MYASRMYEKAENLLKKQITECFESERGPGATPVSILAQKKGPVPLAVVSPTSRYDVSGACAAWSYKAIGDAPLADVYVILAPSHKGFMGGLTQEPFQMPFGTVRVDQELARKVLEKGNIQENRDLFLEEYSVEVQLPFLQYCFINHVEKIKILPMIIGEKTDLDKLALDLKEILVETKKKVCFIVSTNLTHHGSEFKYLPFSENVQENIAELDKHILEFIKKGDYEGLAAFVDEKMIPINGLHPLLLLLKVLKFDKALIEQYYTSYAITRNEKSSISYVSGVFY